MTGSVDRDALRGKSAPLLLCERARTEPDSVAFRSKHLGLYRERSWRDYATLVARTARAFSELGLARGERVAIMGDACEEWLICDLAAQALGAIVYGIYPTASASEVEYQMRDGGAAVFIAENQEYVDKILFFADRLPQLRWIVVLDDAAMFAYRHPKLKAYDELLAAAALASHKRVNARLGRAMASGQRGHSIVRAPDTRPEPGSSARACAAAGPSCKRVAAAKIAAAPAVRHGLGNRIRSSISRPHFPNNLGAVDNPEGSILDHAGDGRNHLGA
jgi:hypothetical protein